MTNDYEIAERAIHFINGHHREQPSLGRIAAHVGVSPDHFQRVFSRWAGISPKRMLQHLTALEAGELLQRRVPVLETSLGVGLSGGSRLHDLFVTVHGMSPAAYREQARDLVIRWGIAVSPFGLALAAVTTQGVCWLSFHGKGDLDDGITTMRTQWSLASLERDDDAVSGLVQRLFGGGAHPIHVMVKGSNFQLRVWEALLAIPPGATATYGDISRILGQPRASRAVGAAVGANAVAWLIPCHRVIRSTGMIGGYRWGTDRKSMMLLRESTSATAPTAVAM